MRSLAVGAGVFVLAALALLPGCDSLFAQSRTTRWLSKDALMGLVIHEDGAEIEAEIRLFDEPSDMPDPKSMAEGETLGGLPLAAGIVDEETKTLVFPLQLNTLVHANSARLLRANNAAYVEFPLAFSAETIEGSWRDGADPPKFTRTFVRCGR